MEFAERLLSSGSDAEILSAKGVTLRRLTSLVENSREPHPATVAPDDGSGISFLPRESAGEVEGYPVVGIINSKTMDLSKCTIEGEGMHQDTVSAFVIGVSSIQSCLCLVVGTDMQVGMRRGRGQCTLSSPGAVKHCYPPGCFGSKTQIPVGGDSTGLKTQRACLHTHTT